MDIFKKLKELDLPKDEYVVIGSGLLAAFSLREANDLDIVVSENLFTSLKESGDYHVKEGVDYLYSKDNLVEIIPKLEFDKYPTTTQEAIDGAETINGFPFLSILETIKFKTALGREKDSKDIKMLEEYMKNI